MRNSYLIFTLHLTLFLGLAFTGPLKTQVKCPEIEETEEVPSEPEILVFVGTKISVERFNPNKRNDYLPAGCPINRITLDLGFKAKYRVIKPIYGEFSSGNIDFETYSHWGHPDMFSAQHTLYFVYQWPDRKVAAKSLRYDVHKTRDGNWGICGDPFLRSAVDSDQELDPYAGRKLPRKINFRSYKK